MSKERDRAWPQEEALWGTPQLLPLALAKKSGPGRGFGGQREGKGRVGRPVCLEQRQPSLGASSLGEWDKAAGPCTRSVAYPLLPLQLGRAWRPCQTAPTRRAVGRRCWLRDPYKRRAMGEREENKKWWEQNIVIPRADDGQKQSTQHEKRGESTRSGVENGGSNEGGTHFFHRASCKALS